MKRIMAIVLYPVLFCMLCACVNSDSENTPSTAATPTLEATNSAGMPNETSDQDILDEFL